MAETATSSDRTLFERIGGDQALTAFSGRLYSLIREDPDLAGVFERADAPLDADQEDKFVRGLRPLTGADPTPEYPLTSADALTVLETAHQPLDIDPAQFTKVAFYAGAVAGALGLEQPEIGELAGLVATAQPFVVDREL